MDGFQKLINEMTPDSRLFVDKSLEINDAIHQILTRKEMLQRDLAAKMDKSEEEVSKWLTGMHNFTLRTLCKLEVALEEPFLVVAESQKEMFFQRSIQNPYPEGSQSYVAYEKGFTECFNHFVGKKR